MVVISSVTKNFVIKVDDVTVETRNTDQTKIYNVQVQHTGCPKGIV